MGQVEQWRYKSWKSAGEVTVLLGVGSPEEAEAQQGGQIQE